MDESSHGGCECSEPPSAVTEPEEPPGSGLLPVLSVAEATATTNLDRSDAGSILNQARNHSSATTLKSRAGMAPSAASSSATATVPAHADTESASRTERNGVRVDSAHAQGRSLRVENPLTIQFRERFYPDTTDAEWDDWRWQSRHRVKTLEQFEKMLDLSFEERDVLSDGGTLLPTAVTPYYMSLLDPENPLQALRKTVVPTTREFVRTAGEADDPLGEDGHSPVPGLVHRYPDRVLLLPLDFCSTYCRYCTRSRVVGHGEIQPNVQRLEAIFHYLEEATQVRDVLISGGDPLALSDEKLDWILGRLRAIPHLEFIRIGTKMPAVLPQRITPELCNMLRKYHPIWMSVHFLHPEECTPEAKQACTRLVDAGIPLGSQTVLLKGVNDEISIMQQLVHKLLLMRVRPYYLYQCDPISGSSHFRTPVSKGLEIIQGLRGFTTGYAVPTYVIDAPGGGGKIPLQPDTVIGRDGDDLLLRNFEGKTFRYPDPLG
jgi:lysine 2,3-aminomutase